MKLNEILSPSFRSCTRPYKPMVTTAYDSDFCHEAVEKGWLTQEQMEHAASRYRLGKSRSGRTIFWMTDELGIVRDGRIGDSWVSQMLKARMPELLREWHAEHCLFGLHLLGHTDLTENLGHTDLTDFSILHYPLSISAASISVKISEIPVTYKLVCVVEAERSAVILSEVYPENIWLATVYPANLNERQLMALQGHRVVLFPRTDPEGDTYLAWLEMADQARRKYHLDISVSSILEENATEEQKENKIDLIDFLLDERF